MCAVLRLSSHLLAAMAGLLRCLSAATVDTGSHPITGSSTNTSTNSPATAGRFAKARSYAGASGSPYANEVVAAVAAGI